MTDVRFLISNDPRLLSGPKHIFTNHNASRLLGTIPTLDRMLNLKSIFQIAADNGQKILFILALDLMTLLAVKM